MFIPAEWTNFGRRDQSINVCVTDRAQPKNICIGSISDLLQARVVVDGLLKRQMCLDHTPYQVKKEAVDNAVEARSSGSETSDTASGVARTRSGRASGIHSSAGANDDQGNREKAAGNKRPNSRGRK